MVKVYHILPEHTNKISHLNNNITNKIPVISAVYMTGCGHCDRMIPKWKIAAREMKKKYSGDVIIALINKDSMYNTKLPTKNIMGYPHIMSVTNNNEIEYNGDRSEEDLMKFMQLHGGSHLLKKQSGGKKTKRKSRKSRKSKKSKRKQRKTRRK